MHQVWLTRDKSGREILWEGKRFKVASLLSFLHMISTDSTDFVMLMENSVVSDGSPQICYDVSILDDDQIEPSESFYATITAQPGPIQSLGIINPSQSSVLIIDNDGKNKCIIYFFKFKMNYYNIDLRVGFEMDQYTFSESAGQVTIHIIKENTVSISENFIVQVAMLQSSTATEGMFIRLLLYR